jgi:hypothetical protein
MNLTSKRMLQFIVGCAGVCALSAFATQTTYVEDTFEDGTLGQSIGTYKQIVTGGGNQFTNYAWIAASGDASLIVTNVGSYVGTRPSTNSVQSNQVLSLSTEGQTLTRNLGVTNNFLSGDPVYVDTLIKFTPSEDNPTISDANVKAAAFVNVSSNLVIYHGVDSASPASTDVGRFIDPNAWYRLTILLGSFGGGSLSGFKVYVNGIAITNSTAYTDDALSMTGPWFLNASANNTLSAVAFQGTGMVDDLVVSSMANGFGTPASILLTLSFPSSLMSVSSGGAITNGGTVTSGSTVVIDAIDWYEITGVTGTGVTYGGATGARVNISTGLLSAATATTVTIGATQYSGSPISTGAGSLPAAKLAAWAHNNSVAESGLSGTGWYDDYLLNVAVGTDANLKISSITVGTNATVVITTDKPGTVTSLAGINGTLKYYTTDDLVTPFSNATTVDVTGAGASKTVGISLTAGKFIKAKIE